MPSHELNDSQKSPVIPLFVSFVFFVVKNSSQRIVVSEPELTTKHTNYTKVD